jgi:hypothetical protein
MLRRVDWYEFTDVSEVCTTSIIRTMSDIVSVSLALKMEAVRSLETLVPVYKSARGHSPEDLHRCRS